MIVITYLSNGLITSKRLENADYLIADGEVEVQEDVDIETHRYSGGGLIYYGERPSEYHALTESGWVLITAAAEDNVRRRRSALLSSSDWTDTASAPARLGQTLYDAWQTYRQALRDITAQPGYPLDITWPTPPGAQS